jgi:hypothetical protein
MPNRFEIYQKTKAKAMEKYLDSFLPSRMGGESQAQGPKKNHNLWEELSDYQN